MLTIDTIPLTSRQETGAERQENFFSRLLSHVSRLFTFLVHRVTAAAATEFFELKPVGRGLFILGRHVITLFALRAL
jgi:hypothetical protein